MRTECTVRNREIVTDVSSKNSPSFKQLIENQNYKFTDFTEIILNSCKNISHLQNTKNRSEQTINLEVKKLVDWQTKEN